MNIEEIENRLIGHLAAILSVQTDEVQGSMPLESLGVTSMGLVEMFVFIEKEFGLELMSAGLGRDDLKSTRSLAEAVARNI